MNKLIFKNLKVCKNNVIISFSVLGDKSFNDFFISKEFLVDYFMDMSDVPESILVIPFICNILPIIWLFDAELVINEVDKSFYESIENFKIGYKNMYPYINFKGKVSPKKIIENIYKNKKSAVLFSGGVDAFTTLINNMDENPELITIWGADIDINNNEGWNNAEQQIKETAELFNLNYHIVKSCLRKINNEGKLEQYVNSLNPRLSWWHDFQHGIGIISHAAPISYKLGIGKVYIASSFTKNDIGNYTCASDPTIDNFVRFGSTEVIHDGYDLNRQMKIHVIGDFCEKEKIKLPVRVCWESTGGRNCCKCEKCYRTIMGILADKKDPCNFGFDKFNNDTRKRMINDLKKGFIAKYNFLRYTYIQKALNQNYSYSECPNDLKWFYKLKFRNKITMRDKAFMKLKRFVNKLLSKNNKK